MVEEAFTDAERQRLMLLVIGAVLESRRTTSPPNPELLRMISLLGGVDTVIVARRAYPALKSFTCPDCGMTTYNPDDIKYGYCGNCHEFFS